MNSDLIGTETQLKSIPDNFKGSLSSLEQIEAEPGGERG